MGLLVIGVLLWSAAHLYPSVFASRRSQLIEKLGNKYQGIFAACIVFSVVLIVLGWRSTVPTPVYDVPSWGRGLNMLTMFIAILLLGAASTKGISRIKQYIRHPMLTAVIVWGVGHLLANGDIRSVILFGGMTTWAAVSIISVSRNEGPWVKPAEVASVKREGILLGITVVVYLLLFVSHRWFAGMPIVNI